MKLYYLDSEINIGRNKKVLVSDLVGQKGEIFNLIKKGFDFDDDVLKAAHIKRIVREERAYLEIVQRDKADNKVYTKETESLKNILKSINTIDSQLESVTEDSNDDNEIVVIDEDDDDFEGNENYSYINDNFED